MKLLNHTSTYFAFLLFLVLSVWTVLFYYNMLDEIYDSMDDGLENQKLLVIQKAQRNPAILNTPHFEDGYYTIKAISPSEFNDIKDSYRDTLMYMQNEKDFEPVRLLETAFKQQGIPYKLKLITSMVEEDDLIEDLLYSIIWLYLGLMAVLLLLNNLVLRKVWDPFYNLLSRLKTFNLEKDREIEPIVSSIDEFKRLDDGIQKLVQKSVASYTGQKQFVENAAHELQTPLAISINKLELLAENGLDGPQLEIIASVLDNLERLTRLNRSLLLLSKIENKQFVEEDTIIFGELIKKILADFGDLALHKNITLKINETTELRFVMNRDLAAVLLTNLIKNALVHGKEGTSLEIEISGGGIKFSNAGGDGPLDATKIFSRFQKMRTGKHSTGLGLAIAKAIADLYGLTLTYSYTDSHIFLLHFPKG